MKLGIYGGSYNPPHLGHMHAAVAAARYLELDHLLLIPAGIPPHKHLSAGTPAPEERFAMTSLMAEELSMLAGIPVTVSRIEIDREGKSYTADTLHFLREQYPDAELWLLMGTDMFLTFQDWRSPEEILSCTGLCAFGRSERDSEELFSVQRNYLTEHFPGARLETMSLPGLVEISSTELRMLLPQGKGEKYLSPQIFGYILRKRLYGTDLDLKRLTLGQLRPVALSCLHARRVRHVLGVEEEAVRLAEQYGADIEKARVAALLHDCTKRLDYSEQLELCVRFGVELDAWEKAEVKLLHAKTGAAMARHVFGADEAVCDAIRWHTTGRADMTLLEKVLYLADYIEPNRHFEGVDALRRAVYEDLDQGLELGLRMSIEEIEARGSPVHPDTLDAYNSIRKHKDHL